MLKKILSGESCAKCRVCCVFDKSDQWEIPLISRELADYLEKNVKTGYTLKPYKNSFVFDMKYDGDGLSRCPMLTEKGCLLGDSKPFDCRIWPFRVMKLDELLAITVSPVCDSVSSLPLKKLCEFLSGGMGDTIFKAAEEYPDMIKDYIDGYPILAVKRA